MAYILWFKNGFLMGNVLYGIDNPKIVVVVSGVGYLKKYLKNLIKNFKCFSLFYSGGS